METKTKIIIIAGALVLAFAAGRFLAPTKVKTETKIVEVEKKTKESESEKNRHKETTIVEVTHPDGSKTTTTTIIEDSQANHKTSETDQIARKETDTKEITYSGQKVHVMGMAGSSVPADLHQLAPVYGLSVSKDILGPVSVGAFGFTNKVYGVSVGLNF